MQQINWQAREEAERQATSIELKYEMIHDFIDLLKKCI